MIKKLYEIKAETRKRIGISVLIIGLICWFMSFILKFYFDMPNEQGWGTIGQMFLMISLIFFLSPEKVPENMVKQPINHIQFNNNEMKVGDTCCIKVASIRKVALSHDDLYGYFSLPYNPISPGVVPSFIFPPEKFAEVKAFLQHELSDVEFIT